MKPAKEGRFQQQFRLEHGSGRFSWTQVPAVPPFHPNRRFSCIFVSASAKDAVTLNQHLAAAGIRAYHAADTREADLLLAITQAKILLVDIDSTFEAGLEVLRWLDEAHPDAPKVVLTARDGTPWSRMLPPPALDVVKKPAKLGELLGALDRAFVMEREIHDPERARAREARVMAAIRATAPPRTAKPMLSGMMDWVAHVWRKLGGHRTRKQDGHA